MKHLHKCVEEVRHSNITVGDKGSKYRANFPNPDKAVFRRARIDDCLVTQGVRADWIVTKVGIGSVVIELKGKDIQKACLQLFSTLSHVDCQPWLEKRRALLIVCSRVPAFDTTVARAQNTARKMGVRLKAACGGGDFFVEELLGEK